MSFRVWISMSLSSSCFTERLSRIQQAAGPDQITLHIGPGETLTVTRTRRHAPSRSREIAGALTFVLSFVGAFALGIVSVGFAQFARFHLIGPGSGAPGDDMDMLLTGGFGFAVSFVLSQAFRLGSKELVSAQLVGIIVALSTIHNLYHWAPSLMETVYPPEWVAFQQAHSAPNTLRFGGLELAISQDSQGFGQEDAGPRIFAAGQ